jgi:acetolactate synthase-1/3 small subunit
MKAKPNTDNLDIVYDIVKVTAEPKRHIFAVTVDNEFGVLARVVGLFSGRGYNIESLTVAEVDHVKKLSRITIVTTGNDHTIEQIKKLLERMVPVYTVDDLTVQGQHVERELGLIKIQCNIEQRKEALHIADIFRATVVDTTPDSLIFELTSGSDKIDAFIDLLRPLGLTEICRTGVAAMASGKV